MRAKPILDILIGVVPLEDWAKCSAPLEALGYDYAETAGLPEDPLDNLRYARRAGLSSHVP
jgi:GrpB-like predicted nucleotidyltransferase (UPF0157 family)